MNKEKKITLVRFVLLVLVLLTVSLIQTVRNEHSFSYAQEPTQVNLSEPIHEPEPIQLNSFTFWDHLKIGLMAFTNPHASTEKSLIFVYYFTDQEFENALSEIPESHASLWLIGQAEKKSEDSQLFWNPMLAEFWNPMLAESVNTSEPDEIDSEESGTKINNEKQLYASNLPIPEQIKYSTYWIPHTEFKERFQGNAAILK